mmetsp:Transcript_5419/g.8177  ORF Transcript_5419/g.8177 Transcript_5419/m.8177 type:complete len:121 (+) Transcript_5419:107-469(+)|eukprot:CAMPEP_0113935130 /NCGR_PEP_ID=MMETSP1339-20121228/2354_1 /TAXON_ID=94617 /ORGANISM="Fibrocapsa japonica" /LENGTH=120 /DNA_ID=CAMNT_0000937181 /DNA_START=90 /DNA_END=452 /DNA_ORIENTATION=+ /assembly_acc=CAM_ASM_000762
MTTSRFFFALVAVLAILPSVSAFTQGFSLNSRTSQRSVAMMGKPVTVTFEPSGKVVEASQGDLIGAVAKKAGVTIPFKCKNGQCKTCEVSLNGRARARVCQGAKIPGGPTKKLKIKVGGD